MMYCSSPDELPNELISYRVTTVSDNAPPAEANDQVSEKDPMTDHRLKFHSTYTPS